jgi:hypothetical protein
MLLVKEEGFNIIKISRKGLILGFDSGLADH